MSSKHQLFEGDAQNGLLHKVVNILIEPARAAGWWGALTDDRTSSRSSRFYEGSLNTPRCDCFSYAFHDHNCKSGAR